METHQDQSSIGWIRYRHQVGLSSSLNTKPLVHEGETGRDTLLRDGAVVAFVMDGVKIR